MRHGRGRGSGGCGGPGVDPVQTGLPRNREVEVLTSLIVCVFTGHLEIITSQEWEIFSKQKQGNEAEEILKGPTRTTVNLNWWTVCGAANPY